MRFDDLQHFVLGLLVATIFGWKVGTAVNLTLEATQANYYASEGHSYASWDWNDTAQDLVVTEIGVLMGEMLRRKIRPPRKEARPVPGCIESPIYKGIYYCPPDTTK